MKMSVGVLVPNGNSEIEKLNDTLQLLSKVSLSLRTSSEDVNLDRPRNRNHSNSARSSGSAHRTPSFGKRDNDACYSCVHKIRRGGRVAKKWVKIVRLQEHVWFCSCDCCVFIISFKVSIHD